MTIIISGGKNLGAGADGNELQREGEGWEVFWDGKGVWVSLTH